MSVNALNIEDVYQILNSIHQQATGRTSLAPTNTGEFVSMATTTLATGVDTVYNALMNTLGQTVFAVRPYERKFSGLVVDNVRWGAIRRKISYADKALSEAEKAWHPVDGTTVDPWKINKSDILEMRFYGSAVYQDTVTIFRDQLMQSFESPEQLGSFVSGQMTHMSNKWEQYLENLNRATLANFIGAKYSLNNGIVHLLTEYNAQTGLSLTIQDVYKPANMADFFRWVRARINTIGRRMAERSGEYQVTVQGKNVNRHTPFADQKIYLHADALDQIDAMVNTVTYHDEPLAYADVEGVSYWQDINDPLKIDVTPSVINANGVVSTAAEQQVDKIFGIMFDRDAISTNIKLYDVANSPYNQVGRYYNTTLTANLQYTNDLTEKGVVLLLD